MVRTREEKNAYALEYYYKNQERLKQKNRDHYYNNKERILEYCRKYRNTDRGREVTKKCAIKNKEKYTIKRRMFSRKFYSNTRMTLLELLGNKCSNPKCLVPDGCKDVRCLQLDHVNGGGFKERKRFGHVNMMYRYYYKYQDEAIKYLQILCANCNWIKRYENGENKPRIT